MNFLTVNFPPIAAGGPNSGTAALVLAREGGCPTAFRHFRAPSPVAVIGSYASRLYGANLRSTASRARTRLPGRLRAMNDSPSRPLPKRVLHLDFLHTTSVVPWQEPRRAVG